MIPINDEISLVCFDESKHGWVIDEIEGNSRSNMIHQVSQRLKSSRSVDKLELGNAYLVQIDGKIVGYVYIDNKVSNHYISYFYFESMTFKDFRGQGLGKKILDFVTDKVFQENPDIQECRLGIYSNNRVSMHVAQQCGFFESDDEDYDAISDRNEFVFIKDNPHYNPNYRSGLSKK